MQEEQTTLEVTPKTVDDIIAGLMGVGIEEYHEPILIPFKGRDVEIRMANIPSEEERSSMLAMGDVKGFLWMQGVKLEILSRAITYLDGIDVAQMRTLPAEERLVKDPYDGVSRDIQVVIRHMLDRWGQETTMVLWKILMVHAQSIEDRLVAKLPDSATMTEVERRLFEEAQRDIEKMTEEVIRERTEALIDGDEDE